MSSFWNRFGPHAQLMRRAALSHPDLLRRLADAPDKTFHVYAIALNARRAEDVAHPDPGDVAASLTQGSLNAILAAAWGAAPPGALAVMDRLGPKVKDSEFYDRLREVLFNQRLGELLRSANLKFDSDTLDHLAMVAKVDPKLHALFGKVSVRAITGLNWLLGRLRSAGIEINERWLHHRLKAITRESWDKLVRELLARHPRVPAPWRGTAELMPLETPAELQRAGKDLSHCLGDVRYGLAMLRTTDAFYLWTGDETAAVQIASLGGGEWEILQVNGRKNAALKTGTIRAIESAFAGAGIHGRSAVTRGLKGWEFYD